MKAPKLWVCPSSFLYLFFAATLAVPLWVAVFVEFFTAVNANPTVVTYTHGVVHVTIPYHSVHSGDGTLKVEVLNPEDEVLGSVATRVAIGTEYGRWQETIRLNKTLGVDDLVWHRVRYRFEYEDGKTVGIEGTESISQILRTPVVHILGQQSYLSGGPAAVRVIVTDSKNEVIAGAGTMRIELAAADHKPRVLFTGPLNRRGTAEAQFRFPAGITGNHELRYVVDTPIGSTEFTQAVRLEEKVSILLTTEKPIYQPGQIIHARALALDRANHEAVSGHKLTFEVEDSRGNKVFKKVTETDKFGIASAEFALADEVNLGTYHLHALMGQADAPTNTVEIALNVERYVLPKFKVAVEFESKDRKTKRGYRPGDRVKGTVRTNYFFGKPVDGAGITVKASSMDVAVFEAASVEGKTDSDGTYKFDLKLPDYFAGMLLSHGVARVLIEATVKDSADHAESRGEPITVSESPLLITAVPEGGTLVPGLENEVFVLTNYADGSPARTELTVHAAGNADQHGTTDEGGVAVIRLKAGGGTQALTVEAEDTEGNRTSRAVALQSRGGQDQILLRTERAVYRAGDDIRLKVFSTLKRGTAYVDIVKEGQTILTRDVEIENGQAEVKLAATPELAGTVDFNAYVFGRDAQPIGDHRLVFVQPADELKIEATANAPVYKPGGEARIHFRVTNGRGQGVSAALGLQVVDEAVFALAEKQPGFAKVFFYLEQELLKPRYEIHSIGMPDVVEPAEESKAVQKDRAARALFSATEMVSGNKFETEFGRTVPQTKYWEYAQRYQNQLLEQVRRLSERLSRAYAENPENGDLIKAVERIRHEGTADLRDAWETNLRIERASWDTDKTHYLIRSAGPDKQFGTSDDLWVYLEARRRRVVGRPSAGPSRIGINIEHERGAFGRRAEIIGTAVDQWGGALEGATVVARLVSSGKVRRTRVSVDGRFQLGGLSSGDYQIQVSTDSGSVSGKLELEPRDRAILSVLLRQDRPEGKTVVAVGDSGRMLADFRAGAGVGFVGGVPGGVAGGAIGGVMGGVIPMVARSRDAEFLAAPPATPMAVAQMVVVDEARAVNSVTIAKEKDQAASGAARVRSFFPEALYINPEIFTDENGAASITIPLADSITTWRMAMMASTAHGALGSSTSSLKVFQDFFVDLDLPVVLTQGDRVSIPVAVYNYSGTAGTVSLQLQNDEWFSLVDDTAEKRVAVDPARVGGSQFTLEAKRIGKFKLTLSAQMKGESDRADIVVREIEVVPNGREQNLVFNGRLETMARRELNFPTESIPDASKIFVRLYPGPLSQVIEGMDSLLRMPFGCFEQTSSSTYPNVLALDYMRRTKKLTPEVHAKAEGFIANGYQRLLTFEVPGGGFSWFGNAPANKILTAYGLMEFYDMSKVHDVDAKLILRTQQWLVGQQQGDGSWKADSSFINEGATNRYNTNVLRITAYVAWALEKTGYQGPALEKAKQFIETHTSAKADAYTLAVLANFATDYGKDREFARQTMQLLLDARTEKDEQAWWNTEETNVYAMGTSAAVETTGLAAQALLKWGGASSTARKAMNYIAAKKEATGAWGTTQATIMALRALLLATEKGTADVSGTLEVVLNGKTMETLRLARENNDLLHQFVFKGSDAKGDNTVEIRFEGKGGLAYQVVGQYFLPWDKKPENEPLSIGVAYDRTHLAQNDIAMATATIKNNLPKAANMVMVDLGIPPGFDLLSEDLQAYHEKSAGQKSGRLEKFTLTATQAILYFDSFAPGDTVLLRFRLRAKYPIRARTFQSRVYEYYDPEVNSIARPVQLEIRQR